MIRTHIALASLAALLASSVANAGIVAFSGALFNNNPPPAPSAACSAGTVLLQFDPSNSTQNNTSNLGSFGNSQSHCIGGFPFATWTGGSFSWAFAQGDTLFGTTSGDFTPTAPGLFNVLSTYVATGGTGRFRNASGSLFGTGVIDARFPPTTATVTVSGNLVLPAVPEPTSWALLITGFAAVGVMSRRQRRSPLPA